MLKRHVQSLNNARGTCQQLQSLAVQWLSQVILAAQPAAQAAGQTGQTHCATERCCG